MRPSWCVLVVALAFAPAIRAQDSRVPGGEGQIAGRIVSSSSSPIAGATVVLGLTSPELLEATGSEGVLRTTAWWTTTTNQIGAYAFGDLPSGRFIVIAAKAGYAGWQTIPRAVAAPLIVGASPPAMAFSPGVPRRVIDLVSRGRASEVNLTLHQPSSLSGRVIGRDGSPAVDQRPVLYITGASGSIDNMRGGPPTDRSGAFTFDDLSPGEYYVGLRQPGPLRDVERNLLTAVTVEEGMSIRNVDISTVSSAFSVAGHIVDQSGRVLRGLQLEYGVAGANHRGMVSGLPADGQFEIKDREIAPGPLTLIARGESEDGPVIGLVTLTLIDGPNELDVPVGKAGGMRGRVVMEGGPAMSGIATRIAFIREGFAPLGPAEDEVVDVAPDGWVEAGNLIGEYRVRVDEPQRWTVKAVRRRGLRLTNDRLVIRNAETLDDVEIAIGPR